MPIWKKLRGAFSSSSGGASPEKSDKSPSPEELFAAEVEAAFRQSAKVSSVKRKPGEFALLVVRDGIESTTYLGNIFDDLRDANPDARAAGLRRFVASLESAGTTNQLDWEQAQKRLAPVLRGATLFSGLPAEAAPLQRPFAPFLIEALAIDARDSIRYATERDLAAWGIDAATAFAAAVENAGNFFQPGDIESYDSQAPYPIWHVAKDDSYETSRLVVPNWLASFKGKVRGRPIAIAPQRSLLIVAGDGDANCLQRLITAARSEFKASARRVSPDLYTVDDKGAVIPYELPSGHSLANELALSRVVLADYEYGQQKLALQKIFGEKAFVASFTAFKTAEGKVASRAVWTKGVPTFLPKVDEIAMNANPEQAGTDMFRVRWEDLLRLAGPSLERVPDLNPPRWGTGAWPTPQALAELRVLAML